MLETTKSIAHGTRRQSTTTWFWISNFQRCWRRWPRTACWYVWYRMEGNQWKGASTTWKIIEHQGLFQLKKTAIHWRHLKKPISTGTCMALEMGTPQGSNCSVLTDSWTSSSLMNLRGTSAELAIPQQGLSLIQVMHATTEDFGSEFRLL